jgi:hypothetical protein
MSNRFLHYLEFVWSKLWAPLLAASLAVGFTYLLKRRDERRELRKKLSAQLYIPALQQLTEAEPLIRNHVRAHSIDMGMWRNACTSGVADKLRKSIRERLAPLYEESFPQYDKAWQELNDELGRVAEKWDSEYANLSKVIHLDERTSTFSFKWWDFALTDGGQMPVTQLDDGDALRIWNRFLTGSHLKALGVSLEQFLRDRWQELNENVVLREYVECRKRVLSEIPRAIRLLKREALY